MCAFYGLAGSAGKSRRIAGAKQTALFEDEEGN
jgi:hypothetical protein